LASGDIRVVRDVGGNQKKHGQLNRGEKDLEDLNEIYFFSANYVHSTHGPRAVEIPGPSVPREISCGSPCPWHPSKSLSLREPNFEQLRNNIFTIVHYYGWSIVIYKW
jgi:hypothetical protein